ncbi:MAG: hypothetical protein CSA35_05750 [Dethiosulfovibrio peptidovorans]|nr:MAG: hypothetical protein CSA35_05750 [Dethiosulfovibrio peptidovorans]
MIAVKDILRLPVFNHSEVIAGNEGLDRLVRYVDVAEVPDVSSWIASDSIFFMTTAYAFRENVKALKKFLQTLVEYKAAGLGIKFGRFLHVFPEELCNYAEQHAFPLIQLPLELHYSDAIRSLTRAILEDECSNSLLARRENALVQLCYGNSEEQALLRFEASGVSRFSKINFVVLEAKASVRESLAVVLEGLAEKEGVLLCVTRNTPQVLFLMNSRAASVIETFREKTSLIAHAYIVFIEQSPLHEMAFFFDEAIQTLRILQLFHYPGGVYTPSDVRLFMPVLSRKEGEQDVLKESYLLLQPLIEYDAEHGTSFLETLWIFMLCDKNHAKTAETLYLHRNSLRYRLSKIESLLPEGSLSGVLFHRLFLALSVYFNSRS